MSELGLWQVTGVARVTIQKAKNMVFVITKNRYLQEPSFRYLHSFGRSQDQGYMSADTVSSCWEIQSSGDAVSDTQENTQTPTVQEESEEEEVYETDMEVKDIK